MADNTLEETSLDEDTSNVTSKRFSKPTLIKIAIGLLTLLIIAGAAYFFFMPAEDSSSEETTATLNETTASPESSSSNDTVANKSDNQEYTAEQIQLLKLREEAVALKEENLKMKERLSQLEEEQNPNTETSKPETTLNTTTAEESDKKTTAINTKAETKQNQYSNLYLKEKISARESPHLAAPAQRQPDLTPPPAPKWGEFAPVYNGK